LANLHLKQITYSKLPHINLDVLDIQFLLKGIGVGISVSAPLGPVGVMCVQRVMNKGFKSGFLSGIGAVVADTMYAVIAGFGLTIISEFISNNQLYLRVFGCFLLLYLGYRVFVTNPAKQLRCSYKSKTNHVGDFFTVFFLTISNPITVIFFGAVFASLGLVGNNGDRPSTIMLTIGIAIGAIAWWLTLSGVVNALRDKIKMKNLLWVNRISGIIVALLGLGIGISVFFTDFS